MKTENYYVREDLVVEQKKENKVSATKETQEYGNFFG